MLAQLDRVRGGLGDPGLWALRWHPALGDGRVRTVARSRRAPSRGGGGRHLRGAAGARHLAPRAARRPADRPGPTGPALDR